MSIHIPISDDYMRVLCPDSIIVHYDELPAIDNLNQILGANGKCIILYLTAKYSGHYTCLFKRNGTLYFFNSYGEPVDYDFRFIKDNVLKEEHEDKPYLKLLIERSGLPVDVNKYCLQAKDTATCGYHCAVRLWNTEKNNEKYAEDLVYNSHQNGLTPDEMVVDLCQKRYPNTEDPRNRISLDKSSLEGGLVYEPEKANKIYHEEQTGKIHLTGYKDIKDLPKNIRDPIEFMKMPNKVTYLGHDYKILSECKIVGSSSYKFETPFSDIDGLNFIEFEDVLNYAKQNLRYLIRELRAPKVQYILPRSEVLYENPEEPITIENAYFHPPFQPHPQLHLPNPQQNPPELEILNLMLIGCIAFGRGIIDIVNKLIATSSKTGYIFSDFKCGYKYKTYELFEQRQAELFRGSLQRSFEDILKPEDITNEPRHWTSEEILNPDKQHELFISIFDTFYRRDNFFVKLDIFCIVKDKYYEASMSYSPFPQSKIREMILETTPNKQKAMEQYRKVPRFFNNDDSIQKRIQDEIFKKISENNLFKSVKRLFSEARISNNKSLLSKILPLLNSDVGILNNDISSLKTLILMFNERVDYDTNIIQKELKIIKGQLQEIVKHDELSFNDELKNLIPNINKKLEIITKELNGIRNKSQKDSVGHYVSKLLNEICDELSKIVNKETREYMKDVNVVIYEKENVYQEKPYVWFKTYTPKTIKY